MPTTKKPSATGGPETTAVDGDHQQMQGQTPAGESELRLDDQAQDVIGQQLKAVYGAIVQEPIPDRFLELLEDLERKELKR